MKKMHEGIILPSITLLVILLAVIIPVSAVPTIGPATGITSSNATFAITGASGSTFVWYGQVSGHPSWKSDNATPSGGSASITIWGSPILGATTYYAKACDNTGCGNTVSFATLAITPIPTRNFDAGFNAMAATHFTPVTMGQYVMLAYTSLMPVPVVVGFILGMIIIGFWRTTKSTRLVASLLMILAPLLMSRQVGLYLGMPTVMQSLGAVLFAAGVAGIILSLIKK